MCNLYAQTKAREAIARLFGIGGNRAAAFDPRAEIYPGYEVPVARPASDSERELVLMGWGFVLPQKDKAPKRVNNTRADKALASPFWRGSFEQRRCLVPATAFCEWTQERPKKKVWFGVTDNDDGLFAFAGLWRHWRGELKGEQVALDVCSILTTTPNELVVPVHPARMPVILAPDAYEAYLTAPPREALAFATPYPAERMRILPA